MSRDRFLPLALFRSVFSAVFRTNRLQRLLLAAATLAITPAALGQGASANLAADFEGGSLAPFNPWVNMSAVNTGARSGNFAALVSPHGGGDLTLAVSAGQSVSVSAWGRGGRGSGVLAYEFLDAGWQSLGGGGRSAAFDKSWSQRSVSFDVPAGAAHVQVTVWNTSGKDLYLDDVSVVMHGAAVAVPSAVETTAVAHSVGSTLNSVDLIAGDMSRMNDSPLVGVNPNYGFSRGPGFVIQGNRPSGSNLPAYYAAEFPHLRADTNWNHILPWFVQFEGVGNAARNTRIQMRHMKLWILSRASNHWQLVTDTEQLDGEYCAQGSNYHNCSGGDSIRAESSGGVSFRPHGGQDFHGWFGSRAEIQAGDVAAVMATYQARLIVDNPAHADDRHRARFLLNVGADYYPSSANSPSFLPGVGMSRAKLITTDWQPITMTTLSDRGKQEPGGGIPLAQFRENHPKLD